MSFCCSHRSDLSRSELSIGEEIEEVSIEGPDNSDKVITHFLVSPPCTLPLNVYIIYHMLLFVVQFDDTTQDLSVSQLSQSHGADYMEDVP